jgi:PPOX class probable F420-dependent enzyme
VPRTIEPELRTWLTSAIRFAVLATIDEHGAPRQSVMWALLQDDDTWLLNTRPDRAKAHDLARDPRASLCFADGYAYVTVEGTVTVRPDPANRDIERLRAAYGDDYDFSSQLGERISLVLRTERVLVHLRRL